MMPPELRKLIIRFIELGALLPLPHEDDPDRDDLIVAHLVLREMAKVQDEMKRCSEMARAIVEENRTS